MKINWRKLKLILVDFLIFNVAYFLALLIRFQTDFAEMSKYVLPVYLYPFVMIVSLYFHKIYDSIWRFALLIDLIPIISSGFLGFLVNFMIGEVIRRYIYQGWILPFSVAVLTALLGILGVIYSRILWFARSRGYYSRKVSDKNILIVGAGEAGVELLDEFMRNPEQGFVVGFVDDDSKKIGRKIRNVKVLGSTDEIMNIVKEYKVDEVIIAIPSASSKELNEIFKKIDTKKVRVRTLPGIFEILNNKISLGFLRKVEISDLLGRKEVKVDFDQIENYIAGKTVLVTGAGGSIGREICRQVAALKPSELILLGKGENSIFEIYFELEEKFPNVAFYRVISDVEDENRMRSIFEKFKPQVVFHAAAHKHVELMEYNPTEAFRVNVVGTYVVSKLAIQYEVERFVYISTDKAIRPTSIMGATKRLGELVIRSLSNGKTKFAVVRFGNVLGSRGSVVEIFKKQIEKGGPVTVTDPRMKRYFMTIPEAVVLVLQAGAFAKNGEVFVLDMGEPISILELAEMMIRLSGFVPHQEIKIIYTGIKPGEKLYEEIKTEGEEFEKTPNERIFKLKTNEKLEISELEKLIYLVRRCIKVRDWKCLNEILSEYIPDGKARIREDIAY